MCAGSPSLRAATAFLTAHCRCEALRRRRRPELLDSLRAPPAVIFGRNVVVTDPTPDKVARLLGLNLDFRDDETFDVLIVGGGPAGVAAGSMQVPKVSRAGRGGYCDRRPGRYLEPYRKLYGLPNGHFRCRPGLARRGAGHEVRHTLRDAATRDAPREAAGSELLRHLRQWTASPRQSGGGRNRSAISPLPLDRLADFEGDGVYYAATEMEARYCKGTEAVIVGGGNSAGQAAMFLSRSASCVRLLVRGASLAASMSSYLSNRLAADPAISIEYGAEVSALHGTDHLQALTIRDVKTGATRRVDTRALFVMVGAAPNTEWLSGLVKLDDKGFVITGSGEGSAASPFATSLPGIFAVGDCVQAPSSVWRPQSAKGRS